MNTYRFEGNWGQLKRVIRNTWSDLSNDDLEPYKENVDELIDFIQEAYGDTKEEAEGKIIKLIKVIK
jgi:uncharacterized protein YjbJ (UPF0337 family)